MIWGLNQTFWVAQLSTINSEFIQLGLSAGTKEMCLENTNVFFFLKKNVFHLFKR